MSAWRSFGRTAIDPDVDATERLISGVRARLEAAELHFGHGYADAADEAVALVWAAAKTQEPRDTIERWLERRIDQRVPLAHILGEIVYWGLEFEVSPGLMVPRSPIGGMIVDAMHPWLAHEPGRVLDLCCGVGCLGALAAEVFPNASVDLVDVDPRAVALARRNTKRFGDRVDVLEGDLFEPVSPGYDLIICNPPYVGLCEYDDIPAEYAHEPSTGLISGEDGLDLWRRIVPALGDYLNPGGTVVGEVGNGAAAFERAFPELMPIWVDLPGAEPQADGRFGVFVVSA